MDALDEIPARMAADAPVIVVAGDAILDRWWIGSSARLSREAPAPVVEIDHRRSVAGGAANAAVNAAAMGARVRFVGVLGTDDAGDEVCRLLDAAGVDLTGVVRSEALETTVKTRIVADEQVLVRADESGVAAPDPVMAQLAAELARRLAIALDGADALLVSDYGSATLRPAVHRALEAGRPRNVVVDAHELAPWRGIHPDLVVPNAREAEALVDAALGEGRDRVAAIVAASGRVLEHADAGAAVVTLDRDGTVLLRPGQPPTFTTAHPVAERFASGAGDTFAAAVTAAIAVGAPLDHAVRIGQHAADVVVRALGTTVCDAAALARAVRSPGPTAMARDALVEQIGRDREAGLRIVFTNGCFDVLHLGHTTYLREASRLGDRLIVAINADSSVRRLKGPDRPVNGEADRAAVVAALECVDYVTVFDGDTPIPLIEALHPDVYVKGGDYTPDMLPETPAVLAYGGEVRTVGYVADHSTSALVDRIRTREDDPV
jgi:rfaE bifunctional protein kinase chain/domain/rfaE bifunctional protein nucleotidyltransferase chain/domain